MRKMIGAMCAALALFATSAAAQPFDDDGLGWGPYYNNHLSPYDGRPLGPPLSALPPGAEYYNGVPRAGYIVTPGPGYGPERSYAYPSAQVYRPARVVRPRHAVRHHRAMKRRVSWPGSFAGSALEPPTAPTAFAGAASRSGSNQPGSPSSNSSGAAPCGGTGMLVGGIG